jgi:microcystin-dependent protein
MADPFIGQINLFAFNFAPRGWATCDGQILGIGQNQALFSLLGITYGGDGTTTFGLPDLRGRVPIHFSPSVALGTKSGAEAVTLTTANIPAHTHVLAGSSQEGTSPNPGNAMFAVTSANPVKEYALSADATMNPASVSNTGGSQPHENRMPFLTISFCIALNGVFPTRN